MTHFDLPYGKLKPKGVAKETLSTMLRIGQREDSDELEKMADFIIEQKLNVKSMTSTDDVEHQHKTKTQTPHLIFESLALFLFFQTKKSSHQKMTLLFAPHREQKYFT